jgi:alkaline phosphatase
MRTVLAAVAGIAISMAASAGSAQTVYPIDRADILTGARFDFKVEFAGLADPTKISITLNGKDYVEVFGKAATFVEREAGKDQSALTLRDVLLIQPGTYKVRVTDGVQTRDLSWNVYDTPPRKAKNVILFIGDGMSLAHRVAARVLAKGIAEGKTFGKLAIDDMPQMALVATAGSDSIITDSANSASAYATGHKAAVNAMGVYADRTPDPLDDPRVETIHQPGQAAAGYGGRHRHQYRGRGCHPRRNGCAHPSAQRIRPHRRAVLRGKARRDHGRRPCELPAEVGGRQQTQG